MYTIGKFAQLLGLSIDTIRHYKDINILTPTQSLNGYFKYDNRQALITLLTKELTSLHMPLSEIRHTIKNTSLNEFNYFLCDKETELEDKIKRLEDELFRLKETKKYSSFGMKLINSVDEFHGTTIYSLPIITKDSSIKEFNLIKEWVNCFPFSYISISLSKEELNDDTFSKKYSSTIGIGITKKYFDDLSLSCSNNIKITNEGLCIRTCIAVKDIFSISPDDLSYLTSYAKLKGYEFVDNTSGRLLFIENADTIPIYYILIWARVKTTDRS